MDDTEYKAAYDKAAAELEAAANGTKPEAITAEVKTAATPAEPDKIESAAVEIDPLAELRTRLEKTEKALKDTQSWGTKNAQEVATMRRENDERRRQAERPAILDANPELEAAIRHVVPQPVHQVDQQAQWQEAVSKAHPGIFDAGIDPELEKSLMTRLQALGDELQDPLVAIREISAEKIAHTERMLGKRFASESAKSAQKSAMSVPGAGAGGGNKSPADADLEAKNRILNMSPAEFEKERRRVMGY